jgi:hypothetical protein
MLQATQAERALNPADPVGSINWAQMNPVVANAPFGMIALATGGDSAANYVYGAGLDAGGTPRIWGYRDLLAVSVPDAIEPADKEAIGVDPVTGRGDLVNLVMKKLGTGTGIMTNVDIEIRQKNTGLTGTPTWVAVGVGSTEAPAILITGPTPLTPFLSNMEYVWAVRVQNTISADAVMSNWTAPRNFTIQSGGAVVQEQIGPIVTSPQGGAMNVDPNLVAFTWAPVYGATEYTVIVATDAALTQTVAGTPVMVTATSFQATGLEYETTYFYSIQPTKPTVGATAVGSFSTKAKAVPPVTTTAAPPVTPQIIFPKQETPAYVWVIIVIGAVLIISVVVLIVRTRRVP